MLGRKPMFGRLLPALVVALSLAAPAGAAFDEVIYYPTSWYTPTVWSTTSGLYMPTTTRVLSPTMSYWPTSYVVPTSYYAPTTYYSPTTYFATAYRPGLMQRLFGPRYSTTSRTYYSMLRPTYYSLTPTVYTTPWPASYVTTSMLLNDPCDVTPIVADSGAAAAYPTAAQRQAAGTNGGAVTPPRSVSSEPKTGGASSPINDGNNSSRIGEPPLNDDARQQDPVPDDPTSRLEIPRNETSARNNDASTRRTALRPAATELNPQPNVVAPNALRGEVVSVADGGRPAANVRVVFTDARQTFRDRTRSTDAQGRFEVVLPNGDWTIGIEDATGKVTTFGNITSASGRFYDESDRVISTLRLNR